MFANFMRFVLIWTLFHFCRAVIDTIDLTTDEFQLDCLLIHNKIRDKHCSKDIRFSTKVSLKLFSNQFLAFDPKLKTLATRRATFLAENDGKRYTRIPDAAFGENVYRHRYRLNSSQTNCKAIVLKWYKEKNLYNWTTPKRVGVRARRFAQLVWNSTQKIGCASVASVGPSGHVFTVCNYYNLVKFPTNSSQNVLSVKQCDQILSKRRFRYKALTTGEWLQQCIGEHNRLRKIHEVQPLTINEVLYEASEKRATEMAEQGFRFFRHKNSKFGENIHWSKASVANKSNGSLDCNASISKWYQEKDNYDWDTRLNHNGTVRHFMQIIWKSSVTLGCSQVQNVEEPKGGIYTVCMYEPKADLTDIDMQWENVFLEEGMAEKLLPVVTFPPATAHDYEKVDELDEETELEKEFKDVDDIIDTGRVFDRQTPAPSLEDMFIKTSTEFNGFDRNEYIHKSKGLRRKN